MYKYDNINLAMKNPLTVGGIKYSYTRKGFPEEIRNFINIKSIYLEVEEITKLPNWLPELINLQELYLDSNKLREFPSILSSLVNLQHLSLSNNDISFLEEDTIIQK